MVIGLRSGRYVVVGALWASRIFNVVIDIQRCLRLPAESAFLAHRGPDEPLQLAPHTSRHEPQQPAQRQALRIRGTAQAQQGIHHCSALIVKLRRLCTSSRAMNTPP
ncbi:predicted protein [Verticillium alfalfae VaMs.102]|uniref:Predicted protein n=1 Tax=Verticillium alfalfae (strain VaMs.102 / ATCC MYA-4576 / FGSC 10136) TaxID=526221 RepID=C9SH22_VERA1|nr:predicted protein [Verticillium alfalfae VaMs.102]EEY17616.1 predicted protein [Verticillium alfalfae VaMs.102]